MEKPSSPPQGEGDLDEHGWGSPPPPQGASAEPLQSLHRASTEPAQSLIGASRESKRQDSEGGGLYIEPLDRAFRQTLGWPAGWLAGGVAGRLAGPLQNLGKAFAEPLQSLHRASAKPAQSFHRAFRESERQYREGGSRQSL